MDEQRLAEKNTLSSGAAHGMGAADNEYFASLGANVWIGDPNFSGIQAVAGRINAIGDGGCDGCDLARG